MRPLVLDRCSSGHDAPLTSWGVSDWQPFSARAAESLEAVVVPIALDAVTLQLTLRRLRALPTASLGLASFSVVPFTRHA